MKRLWSVPLALFFSTLLANEASADLSFKVKSWTFKNDNRCVCCGATNLKLIRTRTVTRVTPRGIVTHTFKTFNTDWTRRCTESPPVGGTVFVYASADGGSFTLLDRFEADIQATDDRSHKVSGSFNQLRLRIEASPYPGCTLKWFTDGSRNLGSRSPLYYTIDASSSGETLRVYFNCNTSGR